MPSAWTVFVVPGILFAQRGKETESLAKGFSRSGNYRRAMEVIAWRDIAPKDQKVPQ